MYYERFNLGICSWSFRLVLYTHTGIYKSQVRQLSIKKRIVYSIGFHSHNIIPVANYEILTCYSTLLDGDVYLNINDSVLLKTTFLPYYIIFGARDIQVLITTIGILSGFF